MVPFYGQGMNCGFEDCLVLDEFLDNNFKNKTPTADQLENVLAEYSAFRNPDAEAMCDLALHNYVEMRSGVHDPVYLFRKRVESWVNLFWPSYMPLYSMVSFSRTRYSVAKSTYEKRTPIFAYLRAFLRYGIVSSIFLLLGLKKIGLKVNFHFSSL